MQRANATMYQGFERNVTDGRTDGRTTHVMRRDNKLGTKIRVYNIYAFIQHE